MAKRILSIGIVLPVLLALVACSSLRPASTSTTTSQSQSNPQSNFSSQPLEDKLAVGTLKLEGTEQAVTATQAKTLLPLWKAVKTMSDSNTTAAAEMTALYSQIEDAMTAQQIQAIKDLNLSAADMQALMQPNSSPQSGSAAQSSAKGASSSSQFQGGPAGDPGGGPGGGGGAPPDAGGGIPGTGIGMGLQITTTPVAGKSSAARRGSMNLMFVDAVIQLLTQRASS